MQALAILSDDFCYNCIYAVEIFPPGEIFWLYYPPRQVFSYLLKIWVRNGIRVFDYPTSLTSAEEINSLLKEPLIIYDQKQFEALITFKIGRQITKWIKLKEILPTSYISICDLLYIFGIKKESYTSRAEQFFDLANFLIQTYYGGHTELATTTPAIIYNSRSCTDPSLSSRTN
jgi:hypothetical protein